MLKNNGVEYFKEKESRKFWNDIFKKATESKAQTQGEKRLIGSESNANIIRIKIFDHKKIINNERMVEIMYMAEVARIRGG